MKPSAYRSMYMSIGKKNKSKPHNLERWINEKWLNLNALIKTGKEIPCGQKYKGQVYPTVCRPSIKISEQTPKPLAKELNRKQIIKAIKLKSKGKRILWKNI